MGKSTNDEQYPPQKVLLLNQIIEVVNVWEWKSKFIKDK